MSPVQASDPREQAIIQAALQLLGKQGSLGLRIGSIANAVDMSVGTFYAHFRSKEDLILELYRIATDCRRIELEQTIGLEEFSPVEHLILTTFRNFLFTLDHPELYTAERLAANLSVWEAATEESRQRATHSIDQIGSCLRAEIRLAIQARELVPISEEFDLVDSLNHGVWSVVVGSNHVYRALTLQLRRCTPERRLPSTIRSTVQAFFIGSGWTSKQPTADIKRLAQQALAFEPLPSPDYTEPGTDPPLAR